MSPYIINKRGLVFPQLSQLKSKLKGMMHDLGSFPGLSKKINKRQKPSLIHGRLFHLVFRGRTSVFTRGFVRMIVSDQQMKHSVELWAYLRTNRWIMI